MTTLQVRVPEKLLPLFNTTCRHIGIYGGRGSGKSWGVATFLVLKAYQSPVRILCCREVQRSISESVLQTIADTIHRLNLSSHFEIQSNAIIGKNGSRFIFEGLRSNVTRLKSLENIKYVWIEEAEAVTATSYRVLLPTIRADDSQIIATFNPRDELDETYQRYVANPLPDTLQIKMNWQDNPYFPEVLKEEMEHMRETNYPLYQHIWEGECFFNPEGSYYANYINDKQITNIPIERMIPVNSYWDLGIDDSTAIIFTQQVNHEIRVIDYYECQGEGLDYYIRYMVKYAEDNKIVWGRHYAPHDIRVRELTNGKSRLETALKMGLRFDITPSLTIEDGIHAARQLLPKVWFDKERCKYLIRNLKNYKKEFDEVRGVYKNKPLHDYTSHSADAFRYLAINYRDNITKGFGKPIQARTYNSF